MAVFWNTITLKEIWEGSSKNSLAYKYQPLCMDLSAVPSTDTNVIPSSEGFSTTTYTYRTLAPCLPSILSCSVSLNLIEQLNEVDATTEEETETSRG